MEISDSFYSVNFYLIYSLIILQIVSMYMPLAPSLQCLFYSLVCIYVGATRSLQFYQFQQKGGDKP